MPKIKLSQSEINSFADDISKVLMDVPLFYVYEVLELANETRQKEGEIDELDVTDSEEEDKSVESSDEENKSDSE